MKFKMPGIYSLEIVCSDPELDAEMDEEIKGVNYRIKWGDEFQPIVYSTILSAYTAAMAAQWGAYRILDFEKKIGLK